MKTTKVRQKYYLKLIILTGNKLSRFLTSSSHNRSSSSTCIMKLIVEMVLRQDMSTVPYHRLCTLVLKMMDKELKNYYYLKILESYSCKPNMKLSQSTQQQ